MDYVRVIANKESDNHVWFEHLLRQIQSNTWERLLEKSVSPARGPRL